MENNLLNSIIKISFKKILYSLTHQSQSSSWCTVYGICMCVSALWVHWRWIIIFIFISLFLSSFRSSREVYLLFILFSLVGEMLCLFAVPLHQWIKSIEHSHWIWHNIFSSAHFILFRNRFVMIKVFSKWYFPLLKQFYFENYQKWFLFSFFFHNWLNENESLNKKQRRAN